MSGGYNPYVSRTWVEAPARYSDRLMSEMIERVAQAICGSDDPDNICSFHRIRARLAIEAMREPTKKMLSAGGFYHIIGAGGVSESEMEIAKREWQAMIDEALR